jgi:transcriptional regulator with XRE-family HTH domain
MKKTGINFATLSRIEREWLQPTEQQKQKLAEALAVKVSWLFPREKELRCRHANDIRSS